MASAALTELYDLQLLDTALVQLARQREHLPVRSELSAIELRLDELKSRRSTAGSERSELAGTQRRLESDLEVRERRSTELERRMYQDQQSASRDLQAMSAELENLKGQRSDLEDKVLALLVTLESFDSTLEELDEAIAITSSEREVASGTLKSAEGELDGERADVDCRRRAAAAGIPADLLDRYERIRSHAGGVGIARLVGSRCDGCHLTLAAAELTQLKRLPDDAIPTCEECGRILLLG